MLTKSNEIRNLGDALLFSRSFQITVDMSPDQCLNRLIGLSQPASGFLNRMRIVTEWGKTTDDTYRPRVLVQRYNRGYYTSAQFDGTILRTEKATHTLVQGKFRIGLAVIVSPVLLALFFAYLALLLFSRYPAFFLFAIVMFVIVEFGEVRRVHGDYRRLQALVYEAFMSSTMASISS